MFRRRSSGSLGRIEIKSSSAVSQLIALRNRSRLPLKRRILLEIQEELPITTNLPSLLLSPLLYVPAAPKTRGAFLSRLGSRRISAQFRLVVAKLLAEVENSFSALVLSVDLTSTVRASGSAVAVSFMSLTMACASYDVTSGTSGPSPNICPTPLVSSARSLLRVTPQPSRT